MDETIYSTKICNLMMVAQRRLQRQVNFRLRTLGSVRDSRLTLPLATVTVRCIIKVPYLLRPFERPSRSILPSNFLPLAIIVSKALTLVPSPTTNC